MIVKKKYKSKNALSCKKISQTYNMDRGGDGMPIKETLDMHALGKRLKLARVARDLTIQQLSALSGVGINQISRLENGDKPGVRVDTLAALAGPLAVSLDHLVGLCAPQAAPSTTRPHADAHEEKPPAKRQRTRKAAAVA
jgi:transcriptional regulator with XRE-family HTH domain